jgi:hypothetical protein
MRRAAAVVPALSLLAGCNLLKDFDEEKVLAASVVATPEIASTRDDDAVRAFAALPAVPAQVVARVWFATSSRDDAAQAPRGVTGAEVTVSWTDDAGLRHAIALAPGTQAGQYVAGAADGLAYVTGTTYAFEVRAEGEVYAASVTAPAAARARELPASGWLARSWAAFEEQPLTFDRSGDDLAFYAAFDLGAAPALGAPTCANLPVFGDRGARDLVGLVADGRAWERGSYALGKASVAAEATCFPRAPDGAPAAYAVGVGIARRGTVSDALAPGSVAVAAVVDAAGILFEE